MTNLDLIKIIEELSNNNLSVLTDETLKELKFFLPVCPAELFVEFFHELNIASWSIRDGQRSIVSILSSIQSDENGITATAERMLKDPLVQPKPIKME